MTSLVDEQGFNQGYALTRAQQRRLGRRTEAMLAAMGAPFPQPVQILELGCGTGEVALQLAQAPNTEVLGLDRSARFIRQAAATHGAPNLRFTTADIVADLPDYPDESYDFIVGNGVLHHVQGDFDRVLPNLKRMLKPGGKLVFWEPNYLNPFIYLIFTFGWLRRMAQLEPGEMAFSPRDIKRRLGALGMARTTVQTRDFLLPNTPGWLIGTAISLGHGLERVPVVRAWAQSLFLVSVK